MFNDIIQV